MGRKITLFELHFDDAQFGSTPAGSDDEAVAVEDETIETAAGSSGSWMRRAIVMVGVMAAFSLVARRIARRVGGDHDTEIDDIEIDDIEAAGSETMDAVA